MVVFYLQFYLFFVTWIKINWNCYVSLRTKEKENRLKAKKKKKDKDKKEVRGLITSFYMWILHNYFNLCVCFLNIL